MTIREIVECDPCVTHLRVDVRKPDGELIQVYEVGEEAEVKPCHRLLWENRHGAMCEYLPGINAFLLKRVIQYKNKPDDKKRSGTEMCICVMDDQIPEELLDLKVVIMQPRTAGKSARMPRSDAHCYDIDAEAAVWGGIREEHEQIRLEAFDGR